MVQPAPTPLAPGSPPTKLEENNSGKGAGTSQNEMLFKRGNAMSGAPIISGTNQLPKPPNVAGMTEKKIISSPCDVTIVFHTCPLVTMVLPGTLSCARMISDRMPPTTPPNTAKHR